MDPANDFGFSSAAPSAIGLLASEKTRVRFHLPLLFQRFRSNRRRQKVFRLQKRVAHVILGADTKTNSVKLLKQLARVQSHLKFSKIQGGTEPYVQNFFKLCQKLRVIMLIKC